jgi:hypothetical protein
MLQKVLTLAQNLSLAHVPFFNYFAGKVHQKSHSLFYENN